MWGAIAGMMGGMGGKAAASGAGKAAASSGGKHAAEGGGGQAAKDKLGGGGGGGGGSIAGPSATYTPVDPPMQTRQGRNMQLAKQAPEDDRGSKGGVNLGGTF